MQTFPFYQQHDQMDCAPTCLRMVAKYYGKHFSLQFLRDNAYLSREGASLLGISEAAESIGFKTIGVKINKDTLINDAPLPCILHWNQNHFVVLYNVNKKLFTKEIIYCIADPAIGLIELDETSFLKSWIQSNMNEGIALLLEPTPKFFEQEDFKETTQNSLSILGKYLKPYQKFIFYILAGLFVASLLELTIPFLTQSLIDTGVNGGNMRFIYIVLFSQLMIFLGKMAIDIIRSWILLHVTARVNISIISDFILKLTKLPIHFFDIKLLSDITQRINDHHRIQAFLANNTLTILFSVFNLVIFSIVLTTYNILIFSVFFIGTIVGIIWVLFFLKKRRHIDYANFSAISENQNLIFEMVNGMQEIKLNNCETHKRWQWEKSQAKLFSLNIRTLSLEQWQTTGLNVITELKNIFISFIGAKAVVNGNMTLGMLLGTSYIVGQMNAPISQLIHFFRSAQDAKISLDRLNEIHELSNEGVKLSEENSIPSKLNPDLYYGDLRLENVSFAYDGAHSIKVLDEINATIPQGKITAVVGASGSGKTTLLKLFLKFYEVNSGVIYIGNTSFTNVHANAWRQKCGTVMQDGFIFGDTIAQNIALGYEQIDMQRLQHAVFIANIKDYIEDLPLSYNTKIGSTGVGLSVGQKQRILIARAVYKNPEYLFFDEATSALDANNESVIMENLDEFFKGKTVIVVAHRLSTVKNADQIIVLEKGKIIESGNHETLTNKKGAYYHLVKNQLELGN
ncbi:MAG: peptidase domain-containing ABC transporter [Chitinophagales bacterium]